MTEAQKAAAKLDRARPNLRVVMRQDRFRHFMGDGALGHEMTCAGRLMIVGGFDGLEADPEVCLSALLGYQNAYWGNYHASQPACSDYQREVRSQGEDGEIKPDPMGDWFDVRDRLLRACGLDTVRAVHDITVDRHWFPDEDCDWASRIINSRVLDKRAEYRRANRAIPVELEISGKLACESDWAMLDLARGGAMALAAGDVRRRAA